LKRYKWLCALIALSFSPHAYNQTYRLSSQNSFGGDEDDNANDIIQTSDGGYILVGSTNSKNSKDVGDSKAYRGNGGSDFLVIKTKANGSLDWSKTFGGTRDEEATSIAKTETGEYVIVGPTRSIDGDANFNGTNGGILMIRLKENGNFVSRKIIPGGNQFTQDTFHYSNAFSKPVVKIAKGGNIYVGGTYERGVSPYLAKQFYLTKLTPTGDNLWEKFFGSELDDQLSNLAFASNGDILMVGSTTALKSQIDGAGNGNLDFLAIRVTSDGALLWQKAWGGDNIDVLHSVIENHTKNGFVLIGETSSTSGSVNSTFGRKDAYFFEINTAGSVVWQNKFGGDGNDNLYGIIKDGSESYMAFGTSDSKIKNVISKGPLTDVLTLTISKTGEVKNIGLYGGEDIDVARGGVAYTDTSWALAGTSRSASEDLNKNNGENDFWFMDFRVPPKIEFTAFKGFKNANNEGEISWKTSYEVGVKSVQLEKSTDNKNFKEIASFQISVNSQETKLYNAKDQSLNYGPNYYRLSYIDNNSKRSFGPSLNIENNPLALFNQVPEESIIKVFPNPTYGRFLVNIKDSEAQIEVVDMNGRSQSVPLFFSEETGWTINVESLNTSSYLLRVNTNGNILTKRFIKK
jgi:hypothetical protein